MSPAWAPKTPASAMASGGREDGVDRWWWLAARLASEPGAQRRARWFSAAIAGMGALALAAVDLAAFGISEPFDPPSLSPLIVQSGLRHGVITGDLLLVVPFAVFAVQVLRMGSAARERRLAALHVAGATSKDLRRIAAAEASPAAVRGAVLAGPVFLLLWMILGVAVPAPARMLPPPGAAVLAAWIGLLPLTQVTAARVAAASARPVTFNPLGLTRRAPRRLGVRAAAAPIAFSAALVWTFEQAIQDSDGSMYALALPVLVCALALTVGPWVVTIAGLLLRRRRSLAAKLAGHRLLADPRTAGRIAGVLLAAGFATTLITVKLATYIDVKLAVQGQVGYDLTFYLGSYGAALAAVACASVVAASALLVGANEQIIDTGRPTAVLVALGVPPDLMRQSLHHQLTAAALAPATIGAVIILALLLPLDWALRPSTVQLALLAGPALSALSAWAGVRLAVRALHQPLTNSMDPANLRAA